MKQGNVFKKDWNLKASRKMKIMHSNQILILIVLNIDITRIMYNSNLKKEIIHRFKIK